MKLNKEGVRKERGEATLSDSTKEPFKDEIHMNLKDSLLIFFLAKIQKKLGFGPIK